MSHKKNRKDSRKISKKHLSVFLLLAVILFCISYFVLPPFFKVSFSNLESFDNNVLKQKDNKNVFVPIHIETPKPLKAIYMTSWVSGNREFRNSLVKIADETEINAIVIDIKDYTGKISFDVSSNSVLSKVGSQEIRSDDLKYFIDSLHKKNIYVIARIAVFQDPYMVKIRPDLAVKKMSDKNAIWKDYKGISWIDAGAKEYWDYMVELGKESYSIGFDELNFDYIRFPSDGNMNDIYYPFSQGKSKSSVLKSFFEYLSSQFEGTGVVLSADLFGMTTTNKDDLNIGQVLENALPYFDYIAPMVYPSHYPAGFNNYKSPNAMPYEVVKFSMDEAVKRTVSASTTPFKMRPWLQDFSLGNPPYGATEVKAQIEATYDAGLDSWMLWNAANKYTRGALLDK